MSRFSIDNFTVEYQKNPIGIDEPVPRFSWKLKSADKDVTQASYHICVKNGNAVFWDTGSVKSGQSVLVEYGGKPLLPETEYSVAVKVTDNYKNTAEATAVFETGLLGGKLSAEFVSPDTGEAFNCPLVFKSIEIKKPVKRARLYATVLGVYEFYINGEKAGNMYMAPFWTNYKKRLEYQTYDVSGQLVPGANSLELLLGKGWYSGMLGFAGEKCRYGDTVAGMAELRVLYGDGTSEVFITDADWQCRQSHITDSEMYLGETQDFTAERSETYPVKVIGFDKAKLIAQENEPVTVTGELKPVNTFTTPNGEKVVDFGQNHTGVVRLAINGRKGQKVSIRHAETLDKDGNFYTDNLRLATSTDTYILSGGRQTLCPHFTFHGYRYIQVIGAGFDEIEVVSLVLHSDMERTGSFETSNAMVNRLYENIVWGQKSNFFDVPTDCPQRDERLGWTGDAQVFAGTAAFNYNVALFFRKWLADLASEQGEDGNLPHDIPSTMGLQDGAAVWGDAATIIPWVLYNSYGDVRLLERQWDSMKGWVDYITSKAKDNLWKTGFQYGDWLALDKEESSDRTGATDKYFVANAFYLKSLEIVRNTAKILGKLDEYQVYSLLYQNVLKAFRREFITATGRLVSETQTACVLALHFDLLPAKHVSVVKERLVNNLAEHKNHLSTGFAGTPYLCSALSDHELHELAGVLLLNDDYPSWLYTVKKGATTIWERWNGILPDGTLFDPAMNSFNHYSYGSIGEFLFTRVAGIQSLEPGYKQIRIKPTLTKGLERVHAEYESVYGKIVSEYEVIGGKLKIRVEIPCNTTAEIHLPEKHKCIKVGSGSYEYEYDTATVLKKERFSFESTFGSILEEPGSMEVLEQAMPGFSANPMIEFAGKMTLNEMIAYAGESARPLFEHIISTLNQSEGETA